MDNRHVISNMLVALLILTWTLASTTALECKDVILTDETHEATSSSADNILGTFTVDSTAPETIAEDVVLHTILANDGSADLKFIGVDSGTGTAVEYIDVVISGDEMKIEIRVKKSMLYLPDYTSDGSTTRVEMKDLIFKFEGAECKVELKHDIRDENTQKPEVAPDQIFHIREDYPLELELEEVLTISDKDGNPPNSKVTVNIIGDCPLMPIEPIIDCTGGGPTPVKMKLTTPLDFDSMTDPTINCKVKLTDSGVPALESEEIGFQIAIESFPDEAPLFEEDYYYITLQTSTISQNLDVKPSPIKAVDQDNPATNVQYTLHDIKDNGKWEAYFEIDLDTGVVTQIKDIEDEELSLGPANFMITATDESNEEATSYLVINMPDPETTTISTTEATTQSTTEMTCPTCEPCSTSTGTTSIMTCPTCEPCVTTSTGMTTDQTCPTCEPCQCTTTSTTDFSCPTCEPCECTTTGTECPITSTCEPCECSTTGTECPITSTCEPCECSTTGTECPITSTCQPCECSTTEGTTTTAGSTLIPPTGPVQFRFSSYSFIIFSDQDDVGSVQVKDNSPEVNYEPAEDEDPKPPNSFDFFEIDSKTGSISVKEAPDTGQYTFVVQATAGSDSDKTRVSIYVVDPTPGIYPELKQSRIIKSVSEAEGIDTLIATMEPTETSAVIISYSKTVDPDELSDHFEIEKEESTGNGILRLRKPLDADIDPRQITIIVTANQYNRDEATDDDVTLTRAQTRIDLTLNDVNDLPPSFSHSEVTVGYPTLEALRKTMGPITRLQATDKDTVGILTYSLVTEDSRFSLDSETGDLFGDSDMSCEPTCSIRVSVNDGINDPAETEVKIVNLEPEDIYTLEIENVASMTDIEEELSDLSDKTGFKISKLYTTFVSGSSLRKGTLRSSSMTAHVQIYALTDGGDIVSLDNLNNKLDDVDAGIQAESFIDEDTFTPGSDPTDVLGYQIAIGILGAIVGLVLVAAIAGFVYSRYKKKPVESNEDYEPKKINSLGNIYNNNSFTNDSEKDSIHEESENYTHNKLIRLNAGQSYEESSSRPNSPTIEPTRNVDFQYPSPPPSYVSQRPLTTPVVTSIPKAELSKPKSFLYDNPTNGSAYNSAYDTKKVLDSADSAKPSNGKSILKNTAYKNDDIPLAGLSTTAPKEPKKDYETNVTSASKFRNIKGSPPPTKKSTNFLLTNQGDDESQSTISSLNSVLKKSNLKTDTSDSDANDPKKVDFKVLVDTIEIEAQNKGPKEKKAEKEEEEISAL